MNQEQLDARLAEISKRATAGECVRDDVYDVLKALERDSQAAADERLRRDAPPTAK